MRRFVFDFGEVIGRPPATFAGLATAMNADPEAFEAAYWELRHEYDRGMLDVTYWRTVAARAGGTEPTESGVAALTEADIAGWLDTDPEAVELIRDLSADGHSLALLSNAPAGFGPAFRRQSWAKYFEHFLVSGELGIAKPDPEIWTRLVERLDAAPADCMFLDDRQVNVDAAVAAGLRAHRWTGAPAARPDIAGHAAGGG